jgi:glutathione S-transferase
MAPYELVVADYNYSSWSMRAGVLLRLCAVEFRETLVHLDPGGVAQLRTLSPSGLAPVLVHDALRIWDSLAIAEYMAEQCPDLPLWPREREARALARSASAEMHSGFAALRSAMPMNIRAQFPGFARSADADRNVKRVQALWTELRGRFGASGPYLCGEFGIVDAMFAPVVTRFRTYDVKLSGACADYADAVLTHPAVRGWVEAALRDDARVPNVELIRD